MDVHSGHVSRQELRQLFEASRDGSLPDAVDEHIANCAECMQAFLDVINERLSLPQVIIESIEADAPRKWLRDATDDEDEVTFVPGMPKVSTPCWNDEDLRTQALLLNTAKLDGTLALHMQTCPKCRSKLQSFFRQYRNELRRTESHFRRFGLSRLFQRLVQTDWYRERIVRKALGAKNQK